jgi:hypothetical protein
MDRRYSAAAGGVDSGLVVLEAQQTICCKSQSAMVHLTSLQHQLLVWFILMPAAQTIHKRQWQQQQQYRLVFSKTAIAASASATVSLTGLRPAGA